MDNGENEFKDMTFILQKVNDAFKKIKELETSKEMTSEMKFVLEQQEWLNLVLASIVAALVDITVKPGNTKRFNKAKISKMRELNKAFEALPVDEVEKFIKEKMQ